MSISSALRISNAVGVYRKSAQADLYRCVPALWQVRYEVLAVEQYEIENTYRQEKDEKLLKFLVLFS